MARYPGHAGLSPPTRGNQHGNSAKRRYGRSIPAHAGEPPSGEPSDGERRVYPRPRGGTHTLVLRAALAFGLSPPTRGNLALLPSHHRAAGSIPAHAGEPELHGVRDNWRGVYPRPRGGTELILIVANAQEGLSPPTRGNLPHGVDPVSDTGSIPAHAGEPVRSDPSFALRRVYPRPRGGTHSESERVPASIGLSPPTRGNRVDGEIDMADDGSIPAHAGGTRASRELGAALTGLSPPTRGNLGLGRRPDAVRGSIPAHAGEPGTSANVGKIM